MTIIEQLARELDRPAEHIENVVRLLDEGSTIPFIARYRKELHGSMDDTALRTLEERLAYLRNLTERKESVKASIAEQEKLTGERLRRVDGGADARRGRGPLPSLQAQAPYPRDRRQGKGT